MKLQKYVYNAITLIPVIMAGPWLPGIQGVGAGIAFGASGIPAAWETRKDRTLLIPLRFEESQWPAVRAFLEWAQLGGTFQFYPDNALGTNYVCYLLSPTIDQELRPERDPAYASGMRISIVIRRTDGVALEPSYL